jgi:hypothetical protein
MGLHGLLHLCIDSLTVPQTIKLPIKGILVSKKLEIMWKKRQWPNPRYYAGICLEGLKKITKETSVRIAVTLP